MKTTRKCVVLLFCLVATLALRGARSPQRSSAAGPASPVVVELFTSEGCSSCPPADALLVRLSEQRATGHAEVIALEEHVDYWNDLGWSDPYSSHDWTVRQSRYAGPLGNDNPYTPQMVVDGSVEFVGSRVQEALKSIAEAAERTKTPVSLSEGSAEKRGTAEEFTVTVGKLTDANRNGTAEVWLAITESGLHSAVTGGENAGRDLRHAAIVRSMRKIGETKGTGEVSFSGDATMALRSEWKRTNLRAVVLVQERKTLKIVGAAQIPLRP